MNLAPFAAVLNILAPVFLVVLLGAWLRRIGFLTEAFSSSLNKLVFWVALPCLLFNTIAGSTFHRDSLDTAAVLMISTLVIAALAWFGASFLGISPQSRGSFTQSVFRSNNAYVGLPVIVLAYAGTPGGRSGQEPSNADAGPLPDSLQCAGGPPGVRSTPQNESGG